MPFYRFTVTAVHDVEIQADNEDEAETLIQNEIGGDAAIIAVQLDEQYEGA